MMFQNKPNRFPWYGTLHAVGRWIQFGIRRSQKRHLDFL